MPAVPPNDPGAGSAGSGMGAEPTSAGEEVSLELSFDELSEEELSEEEPSSVELELEELDESPELLPKDPDVLGVAVELAIELDAAVTEPAVLTAAADVPEAKVLVAATTDEPEMTEVVVPLPAPAPPLLADTMTKSTQLSYVCFAAVPNQNHCSTHSPATLQSLAARSVGIVTAKLVLLAGRTLSFSSA